MTDTLDARQDVPAVHRRPVRRRGVRRQTLDVVNPATGEVVATVPAVGRGTSTVPSTRPRPRSSPGSRRRPRPQPRAAQDRRHPRRERATSSAGSSRARRGKPIGAAIDEMATCVGPVPLLRRRLPGDGRPRGQRVPRGPHLDHPARPDRRRRLDRALELPAVHGRLEARARRSRPATRSSSSRRPGPRSRRCGSPSSSPEMLPRGRRQRPVGLGRRRSATRSSATRRSAWSRSPATP